MFQLSHTSDHIYFIQVKPFSLDENKTYFDSMKTIALKEKCTN